MIMQNLCLGGCLFFLAEYSVLTEWEGHTVRLIRTELHPPLPLFGDSLQQLLSTTAALYRHFQCFWGDTPIKKLKVSHSLFVVNYLNMCNSHILHYSWLVLFLVLISKIVI